MDDTVEAMDRISELPHFIIHQIMSHLKSKDVARTSILSKTWYQLRNSFPILVFNQKNFFPKGDRDFHRFFLGTIDEKFRETVKKFLEFVDSSLLRFCESKLRMQCLIFISLTLLDVKGSAPKVDKWIGLAVENGVKVLKFKNAANERTLLYTLPQTIFNANLVTTLELSWCRLEQPSETLIRLHSLKRVMLRRVCLDERMIQKLTSECPVLQHLSFMNCWGFKCLRVSKAFKLKTMKIQSSSYFHEIETVEISVPSLQQLTLHFKETRRPCVLEVARSPHLKKLDLTKVSFASEEFNNLISKFPTLENLWVCRCFMPGRIKISSNQLKNLRLSDCKDLTAIDVDTPNLLSLTYGFKSIPTTSINVPCPWKISFSCRGGFDTHWYLKLKKCLGASTQIEYLGLSLISGKVVSNLDDLGGSSPSLALQVGNLELLADVHDENLLDGVFWICYPRTLRVTVTCDKENKFLEWITDQLLNRDVNCCNSRHIKCWRHYLKDIKTPNYNPKTSIFHLDWDITGI